MSVSIVIPAFNAAWCIERAVRSCQAQTLPADEIIIVDDCSTDNTPTVVRDLMCRDSRIVCYRLQKNGGHLAALTFGAQKSTSDWIALLDADDELVPDSIRTRVGAANAYFAETGVKPQLVYGDHVTTSFARLRGEVFPYLCKELCLCQTTTMMLGKECVPDLPASDNPWNTDDEIVLAIGRKFHVVHCGAAVAKYYTHASPTRMGNNPHKVFRGIRQLVHDHRADILRHHGVKGSFLWRLRVLRAFVRYQGLIHSAKMAEPHPGLADAITLVPLRLYLRGLHHMHRFLNRLLKNTFETDYF
ncbi:MAG: glycosyltransferase family 2 protein [Xanthobacteraceae bacterium]